MAVELSTASDSQCPTSASVRISAGRGGGGSGHWRAGEELARVTACCVGNQEDEKRGQEKRPGAHCDGISGPH
eukprot:716165-Rhodomonas_salina.1